MAQEYDSKSVERARAARHRVAPDPTPPVFSVSIDSTGTLSPTILEMFILQELDATFV